MTPYINVVRPTVMVNGVPLNYKDDPAFYTAYFVSTMAMLYHMPVKTHILLNSTQQYMVHITLPATYEPNR